MWNLATFAIHQIRANGRPSDALFRQQQALLRVSPPPSTVMTDVVKLWWSWRREARRPFYRSILLVMIALLFTAGTLAASIFSSLVVSSGSLEVQVNSPACGWSNARASDTPYKYPASVREFSDPFNTRCSGNSTFPNDCDIFAAPRVNFTNERASCPFGSFCGHENATTLDSGLQDATKIFGLNIPTQHRVRYRKKTTCQVLSLEGHTEVKNMSDNTGFYIYKPLPGEQVLFLNYGNTSYGANWTYDISLAAANVSSQVNIM
jgi:hypothetical protein